MITVLITEVVLRLQSVGLQSKDMALVSPSYNGKKTRYYVAVAQSPKID